MPERPTLNADLLERTMRFIEAHPQDWDQNDWGLVRGHCGTVACFAGWATILADPTHQPPEGRLTEDGDWFTNERWMVDEQPVERHARDLLGLTGAQQMILFAGGNTLAGLRAGVDALIATNGALSEAELRGVVWAPELRRAGALEADSVNLEVT